MKEDTIPQYSPSLKQQVMSLITLYSTIEKRNWQLAKELTIPIIIMIFTFYADTVLGYWKFVMISTQFAPIYFINYFVYKFVEEKSSRIKETYKIMGLTQLSYDLGWFIFIYRKMLLIFAFSAFIPFIMNTYDQNKAIIPVVFVLYLFYYLCLVHQAFFFSVFFSSPRIATQLYLMVFLGSCFLFFAGCQTDDCKARDAGLSVFPQFALIMGILQTKKGAFGQGENQYAFNPEIYMLFLIAGSVFYLLTYLYLNQVLPNEYGVRKSIFFPCMCRQKKKKSDLFISSQMKEKLLGEVENGYTQNLEDFSNAIYYEHFQNPNNLKQTVVIKDIKKKFGNFEAVGGIDLCLYHQQIFCLLGHNGAGKTTLINLLTGMLQKTDGKAIIEGYDLSTGLDFIRQNVGLCAQKDVLFEDLTTVEHLEFMARVKGVPEGEVDEQVTKLLGQCLLKHEKYKKSKNLSGGNKRKLSLALALIGGSKILFLDEPSSGLDPSSRRIIWQILKTVKQEKRTIILTTHHLEEAEELAERIGIMAKGKLLTVGSVNFIKTTFGIGFHLEMHIQDQQNLDKIRENLSKIVKNIIPSAKYNQQSTENTVKFILPFDKRDQFQELFRQLEQQGDVTLNLQINSLEEAFVNIGMDEENLLKMKRDNKNIEEVNETGDNYTNFENIEAPAALNNPPKYVFKAQFSALFWKRFYLSVRSGTVIFGNLLPVLMIVIFVLQGAIQCEYQTQYIDQDTGKKVTEKFPYSIPYYDIQTILLPIGLTVGLVLYSTGFGISFVSDKENHLKYALNVMGCRSLPYWVGNLVMDFIIVLFGLVMFFVAAIILDQISLFNMNIIIKLPFTWIYLYIFTALPAIAVGYLCSNKFEKTSKAQLGLFWFIGFFFAGLQYAIMSPMPYSINKYKYDFLQIFFLLTSPFYTLQQAVLAAVSYYKDDLHVDPFTDSQGFTHKETIPNFKGPIPYPFIYPLFNIVQFLLYFWLTVKYDMQKNILAERDQINDLDDDLASVEPEIKEEQQRLMDPDCKDIVKVVELSKQYPNGFTAIRDNNFGVKEGEIFGLLGPNGAGKSTSFNILTSLIPKSAGSVKLKDIEVDKGIMDIYQNVGICPQFNPIWETLTVYEHLKLFGLMKGLQGQDLNDSINYFMQVMQLEMYKNVKAGVLSGGNKRKLCVSLALIGGPEIQFFDEPSAGVDPIAKRFLWNALNQNLKKRNAAITITTHSMVEAESLCHKIGILINGRMQCYGSPEFLKKKYGEGYIISVEVPQPSVVKLKKSVQDSFQNCSLSSAFSEKKSGNSEVEGGDSSYDVVVGEDGIQKDKPENVIIKMPYEGFSFYKTFSFFNDLLDRKEILDFSVTQSSIEKIFIEFSKLQHSDQGAESEKKKKK